MKYIASCSFGKDSTAMTHRLIEEGMPLDEAVLFDWKMEFKAIYNLRDKHINFFNQHSIAFTEIVSENFGYKMFETPVKKRGTNEIHKHGYSWCGGTCRWGTAEKLARLEKYIGKDNIDYVGIAADEWERLIGIFEFDMTDCLDKKGNPVLDKDGNVKRKALLDEKGCIQNFKQISNFNKRYPLVEWRMNEADCLKYCYEKGLNWLEKTDSIYPVPEYIDLYQILDRVSCWCCRNKNLKELKAIYYYFTNSYWKRLKEMQAKMPNIPMKHGSKKYDENGGNVFELEKRFKREIEQ